MRLVGATRRFPVSRKPLLLCLVVAALLLSAQPVFAQLEPYSIFPYPQNDQRTYEVASDQSIVIGWAWAATTPGLVRAYIAATEHQLDVVGITDPSWHTHLSYEDSRQYNGDILPWNPLPYSPECIRGHTPTSFSPWMYDLGPLPVGMYELHWTTRTNHRVTDGCLWGEHGRSSPALPTGEGGITFYITVLPGE